MAAARLREGWKSSGMLKGTGIPAPSGQYVVGCVDLMHKLDGESDTGLLVRLFYPSVPLQQGEGYQYAKWTPHKRYLKGFMEFQKVKLPGLVSGLANLFLDPRLPAFDSAPLFQDTETATKSTSNAEGPSEPTSTEDASTPRDGDKEGESTDAPSPDDEDQPRSKDVEFPVIVFSHGLGAMRTVYSAICCDLASHGYVVSAVEHKDRSACVTLKRVPQPGSPSQQLMDQWLEFYHRPETEKEFPLRNGQVKQRASEARQALDLLCLLNEGADIQNMLEESSSFDFGQFKGRLDVATAAVTGHSFGGATTIQTLSEDSRFKCGIGLDTWMLPIHRDILNVTGIDQPLLFINSFDFQWKDNIQKMMKLVKAPDERGVSQCSLITLKDTNHYNQADVLHVMPITGKMSSRLPPPLAHQINQELCHAFLKRHLHKDPAYQERHANLDGGEGCSELVIHGTNVDLSEPTAGEEQQAKTQSEGEESPSEATVTTDEKKVVEEEEREKSESVQEEAEKPPSGEGAETAHKQEENEDNGL